MATKREKLEARAEELGLTFVPATTDDELQQLINDFQNKDDKESEGSSFYKSRIAGLSVQIGDEPERDQQPTFVRFTPYEFYDEKRGEHYTLGLLATDEPDAIEVLDDDVNAESISQEEYEKLRQDGKRAKY